MGEILHPEELRDRARDLGALNGFDLVFVELDESVTPPVARLTAEFHNDNGLDDILDDFANNGVPANQLFRVDGGRRRLGGGLPGQVQVTEITAGSTANALVLTVSPIGDYSTYRLVALSPVMDPIFAEIRFKFRPGCFNLNCRPAPKRDAPDEEPRIDYLARDYHSFKHLLLTAMAERVPGWAPTSEADLDQVIIHLLAARGDELADKQDRVANEAFFPRARKRISLARHARLVDYHIHQGNQATTWLALEVTGTPTLPPTFACWTGGDGPGAGEIFEHDVRDLAPGAVRQLDERLNALALYTWGDLVGALEKGSTEADVTLPGTAMTEPEAIDLADLLRDALHGPLLLEEALNPETGRPPGRDPRQRQLLRVTVAEPRFDPLGNAWMVRVRWRPEDALKSCFVFVTRCPGQPVERLVSLFRGNVAPVAHGTPNLTLFRAPGTLPDAAMSFVAVAFRIGSPWGRVTEAFYVETPRGRLCPLPEYPLAYRDTPPGGEIAPASTAEVSVEGVAGWSEQIDLIESRDDAEHFVVETDEMRQSAIRFGRPPNGAAPPAGSWVAVRYQTGEGPAGNVGADRLVAFSQAMFPTIARIWNPFDVTNGRLPESPEVVRRRAPEAYRARQLRAVTLADYRKRAEELPFVQRAAAAYDRTGSWRTVRITLDPGGAFTLTPEQLDEAAAHLEPVRLIGEDLEIRPPDFLPLDILLVVCAKPRFWPEDLRLDLEEAFSEGYTASGEPGFFHPDRWTFGQSLYASQLVGRALAVDGVDRVLTVGMRPWDRAGGPATQTITVTPGDLPPPDALRIDAGANQIIRVANDPDALELGRLTIEVRGGRR